MVECQPEIWRERDFWVQFLGGQENTTEKKYLTNFMGDKNLFLGPVWDIGFFLKGVENGGTTLGKSFLFFEMATEEKKGVKLIH